MILQIPSPPLLIIKCPTKHIHTHFSSYEMCSAFCNFLLSLAEVHLVALHTTVNNFKNTRLVLSIFLWSGLALARVFLIM